MLAGRPIPRATPIARSGARRLARRRGPPPGETRVFDRGPPVDIRTRRVQWCSDAWGIGRARALFFVGTLGAIAIIRPAAVHARRSRASAHGRTAATEAPEPHSPAAAAWLDRLDLDAASSSHSPRPRRCGEDDGNPPRRRRPTVGSCRSSTTGTASCSRSIPRYRTRRCRSFVTARCIRRGGHAGPPRQLGARDGGHSSMDRRSTDGDRGVGVAPAASVSSSSPPRTAADRRGHRQYAGVLQRRPARHRRRRAARRLGPRHTVREPRRRRRTQLQPRDRQAALANLGQDQLAQVAKTFLSRATSRSSSTSSARPRTSRAIRRSERRSLPGSGTST